MLDGQDSVILLDGKKILNHVFAASTKTVQGDSIKTTICYGDYKF